MTALLATHLAAGGGCASAGQGRRLKVQILAINDFHGQIGAGHIATSGLNQEVGGAPVLAAYLRRSAAGAEDRTFLVSAGDLVMEPLPDDALGRPAQAVAVEGD